MSEPRVEELKAALSRHASADGEVFPSGVSLIDAEEHWSGRLWDVTRLVMSNQETMRYLAGGNRADEVASCAARWCETDLTLEQIKAVFAAGGYDPDPFAALAGAGLLEAALHLPNGSPRIIQGERAGVWISDTFALASEKQIVEDMRRVLGPSDPADQLL